MGEIKSVKVDNWGVFFLQKLQNFFNKTDYCDLTLQFHDNSQLKVHRLVLSACTDYFNVLEQTCEVVDDALIMPNELQADVVVPIVNFMYTGTLEFELKMYGKLLRTAKEMNMTVLLKLLEAHRRTMEGVNRAQRPPSPKMIRKRGAQQTQNTAGAASQQQQSQQQRRILTAANAAPQQQQQQQQQRRIVQQRTNTAGGQTQQPQFRQQIGSTSLLKTSASGTSPVKTQYGSTTIYATTTTTTSPLQQHQSQQQFKHEPEDYDSSSSSPLKQPQQPSSPFEQLRKGYNNNKRPASSSTFISPPTKKPNIEDVKEFAEQQRMRKQIAAEYGDDQEYEGMLDDDIHADDDDDEATATAMSTTPATPSASTRHQQQQQQQQPMQQHQSTATITFKQEQNDKPPTIVVKDSSNSNMNHARIISEVLRQYPHLVKSNKNIKLKIMPNVGGQTQKIIVKKEQVEMDSGSSSSGVQQQQQQVQQHPPAAVVKSQTLVRAAERAPIAQPQPAPPAAVKLPAPKSVAAAAVAAPTATAGATTQKRRIDSKTMHALIALGAENTTGPWLCLRCGVNGRPISIPSYRGFRRHLINTHKEHIDAALCEQCGWRSANQRELHFHAQLEHKIKSTLYTYPECLMCTDELFIDTNALNQHMLDAHPDENKQQCIYCNKIFAKELQLYTHMKTYHKRQALEDGIIDYSDDEEFMDASGISHEDTDKDTKIKILSDISLPIASSLVKLEHSPKTGAVIDMAGAGLELSSSADNEFLKSSGGGGGVQEAEPKFVNADGNEMLLTDEQRKEIMSQLNQEHEGGGGVVMVLNEPSSTFAEASSMAAESNISSSADVADEEEEQHEHEYESQDASAAAAHVEDEEEEHEEDVEDIGHLQEEEAEADEEEMEEHDNEMEHDANTTGCDAEESFDDAQIYNEFTAQRNGANVASEGRNAATTKSGSTTTVVATAADTLDEWAENLISEHELADETAATVDADKVAEQKAKKDEDISKKLKELTGDWSDDENEDDIEADEATEVAAATSATAEKEEQGKVAATEEEEHDLHKQLLEEPTSNKKNSEHDVESADKTNIADEEAKLTGVANDEEEHSNVDEDDVDAVMKSLHKSDISETAETEIAPAEDDDEEVEATKPDMNTAPPKEVKPEVEEQAAEKMDVDEEKEVPLEKETQSEQEKKESTTVVVEEIKEEKNMTQTQEAEKTEVKAEDEVASTTTASAAQEGKSTDTDVRKMLLDELIAEASIVKNEEDVEEIGEIIDADAEMDKLKAAGETALIVEKPKSDSINTAEAAELESTKAKASSSSSSSAAAVAKAEKAPIAAEDAAIVAADATPPDAIIKDAEKQVTETDAAGIAATKPSTALAADATDSTKTAAKVVQSLEREWADDDDDVEEEL